MTKNNLKSIAGFISNQYVVSIFMTGETVNSNNERSIAVLKSESEKSF